jgi:hypothetical protein
MVNGNDKGNDNVKSTPSRIVAFLRCYRHSMSFTAAVNGPQDTKKQIWYGNIEACGSVSNSMPDIEERGLFSPEVSASGLGIITAAIFLSGEMAGSGVLALSGALVGTGWSGLLMIAFFCINATYIGCSLGRTWEILAETFKELQEDHIRDPYPLIAEKAGSLQSPLVGKIFRYIASGK